MIIDSFSRGQFLVTTSHRESQLVERVEEVWEKEYKTSAEFPRHFCLQISGPKQYKRRDSLEVSQRV